MPKRYEYFSFDNPYKMLATALLAEHTPNELIELAKSPLLLRHEAAQDIKLHLDIDSIFADCIFDVVGQHDQAHIDKLEDDIVALIMSRFDTQKAAQCLSELLSEMGLLA